MSEQAMVLGSRPRQLPTGSTSRVRSTRVVIAVLVVVAAIGYLIYTGFQSSSVYYLTVSELQARAASPLGASLGEVRVAGVVQDGSVQRVTNSPIVHFTVGDGSGTLPVTYSGLVPDIFGPGIQVVVEGHYTNGVFQATTMLAKCPSKYTAAVPTPVTAP